MKMIFEFLQVTCKIQINIKKQNHPKSNEANMDKLCELFGVFGKFSLSLYTHISTHIYKFRIIPNMVSYFI